MAVAVVDESFIYARVGVAGGSPAGTVKLSLLGTDGGPNVGNERRRGDRIRLVQALAPASTGPVRGGCVQSKLIGTVPRHPSASTQDCRAAAWSRS